MIKKICNLLLTLLLIVVVGISGSLFIPQIMGYKVYTVLSSSMEPTYKVGGVIYMKPVNPEQIKVDDSITFNAVGFNTVITHRVIQINEQDRTFVTKGDNNSAIDVEPVPFEYVEGRVDYYLPIIGFLTILVKKPIGIIGLILLITIPAIIAYFPDKKQKQE